MLLRRSTDIYPKELARGIREFFNSLIDLQAGCAAERTQVRSFLRALITEATEISSMGPPLCRDPNGGSMPARRTTERV